MIKWIVLATFFAPGQSPVNLQAQEVFDSFEECTAFVETYDQRYDFVTKVVHWGPNQYIVELDPARYSEQYYTMGCARND